MDTGLFPFKKEKTGEQCQQQTTQSSVNVVNVWSRLRSRQVVPYFQSSGQYERQQESTRVEWNKTAFPIKSKFYIDKIIHLIILTYI